MMERAESSSGVANTGFDSETHRLRTGYTAV